jgi:N-acetylneuraminic acid mutarotase
VEALEDRCLLSINPALPPSVGLVAESAAVGAFNNVNDEVATANSGSLAAGREAHESHHDTASWTAAASMAEARSFYTATVLDDGQVLVAGGFVRTNGEGPPFGGAYSAGVEIYDPSSNTWTPTGHLTTARAGHAAALLEDGRVLVAGGQMVVAPGRPPVFLDSAEIYDPATGQWTVTGSMHVRRQEPILTLLPDGRVFVAGSARTRSPDGRSAEIYDPDTGQWTRVADMSTPRNDHIQVLLDDGRVLVAGGFRDTVPAPGAYFASAEIYDPQKNRWTPTGSMTMPRADPEGIRLKDGRVLVTGGFTVIFPQTRTNTAEIYDPATGQWTLTGGAMSDPKVDHAIALLEDGRVLVAGGVKTLETPVASADLYDPRTDTWTPVPSMSRARYGISAVTLKHGRVLVVGGLNVDPDTFPTNALASAEIFVPAHHHGHGEHGDGEHGHGQHALGALVFPGTNFTSAIGSPAGGGMLGNHDEREMMQGFLPAGGVLTPDAENNPEAKVLDENASANRRGAASSRHEFKSSLINGLIDLDTSLDDGTNGSA